MKESSGEGLREKEANELLEQKKKDMLIKSIEEGQQELGKLRNALANQGVSLDD